MTIILLLNIMIYEYSYCTSKVNLQKSSFPPDSAQLDRLKSRLKIYKQFFFIQLYIIFCFYWALPPPQRCSIVQYFIRYQESISNEAETVREYLPIDYCCEPRTTLLPCSSDNGRTTVFTFPTSHHNNYIILYKFRFRMSLLNQ